jgi:hypothetical protein
VLCCVRWNETYCPRLVRRDSLVTRVFFHSLGLCSHSYRIGCLIWDKKRAIILHTLKQNFIKFLNNDYIQLTNFSLHQLVQNDSGAHPAQSASGDLSPGIKRPGCEADSSPLTRSLFYFKIFAFIGLKLTLDWHSILWMSGGYRQGTPFWGSVIWTYDSSPLTILCCILRFSRLSDWNWYWTGTRFCECRAEPDKELPFEVHLSEHMTAHHEQFFVVF